MNDVCWTIDHAKALAAPDEIQMKFGALSENWPIFPHLDWRNSQVEMECIKQTMETTGSCALFSSEPVPVLMMLLQGRATGGGLRNEKHREARPGREFAWGEFPNWSTQSRFAHSDRVKGKTVLHLVIHTLIWSSLHILTSRDPYKGKLTEDSDETQRRQV